MKRKHLLRFLCVVLLCVFCLMGCAPSGLGGTPSVKNDQAAMLEYFRSSFGYEIPVAEATHGQDYSIVWQDPGMEAAIRTLLDKPEGDILHSDIWDFCLLDIAYNIPRKELIIRASVDDAPLRYLNYAGEYAPDVTATMSKDFPWIASLEDLQHFDGLQYLSLSDSGNTSGGIFTTRLLDLSGLDNAANLKAFCARRIDLKNTKVVSSCQGLKILELHQCSIASLDFLHTMTGLEGLYLKERAELNLTPLAGLPNLSVVRFQGCDLKSLEPLATLPALRALDIGFDTTYPSLEPLTKTRIEVLDMACSMTAKETDLYDGLDYEPLTRIPSLALLDLTNHRNLDAELGNAIVAGSPELRYFIVAYTPAARNMERPELLIYFGNNR